MLQELDLTPLAKQKAYTLSAASGGGWRSRARWWRGRGFC